MNVSDTVEELTQIAIKIRGNLESSLDRKEREQLANMLRKQIFEKSKERNTRSNDKENVLLAVEEIREYFVLEERERALDQDLLNLRIQQTELPSDRQTIHLLHQYNRIKDLTQVVVGAIAVLKGTTVKSLYEQYHHQITKNSCQVEGLEWFNVAEELSIYRHLAGKIIVLDFFTYCCINCMHVLPDLDALEKRFSVTDGLLVIGVHSAKFANERDSKRLLSAIQRNKIKHPVVNDAALSTWRELGICCWPTLVMIGPTGELLAVFVGEGHGDELLLYADVALRHFKSMNKILEHDIPLQAERHLLAIARNESVWFPGKVEVMGSEQGDKLIIADTGNNRILVADNSGIVERVIGGCNPGFRDGDFREAKFRAPQGVCAFDGSIYVADNENHAIRKIDLRKEMVTTAAGTGVQGHDYTGGKIARDQALSSPWDLAVYEYRSNEKEKSNGVLLIAVAGTHQIWALFLQDTRWWKNREYKAGTCVAIVGSGKEENRNNAYPHAAGLAQPSGLTVAQEKKIAFFADSESSSVRSVDLETGRVSAVCGANRNPADLHDFGDCDGARYAAKLQHPLGIAWHSTENVVYLTDTYNHKIKKIDVTNGYCKTIYGDRKPNERFSFDEPNGIAVSSDQNLLYVADSNNHAIKVIDTNRGHIATLPIKLPVTEMENSSKNVYVFDTAVSKKGGEINMSFNITFFERDLKLNWNAPQRWTINENANENANKNENANTNLNSNSSSKGSGWTAASLNGEISTPILIRVSQGSETHQVPVTFDIVACKATECLPKKLTILYRVHRTADAADIVTEKRQLVVK